MFRELKSGDEISIVVQDTTESELYRARLIGVVRRVSHSETGFLLGSQEDERRWHVAACVTLDSASQESVGHRDLVLITWPVDRPLLAAPVRGMVVAALALPCEHLMGDGALDSETMIFLGRMKRRRIR